MLSSTKPFYIKPYYNQIPPDVLLNGKQYHNQLLIATGLSIALWVPLCSDFYWFVARFRLGKNNYVPATIYISFYQYLCIIDIYEAMK